MLQCFGDASEGVKLLIHRCNANEHAPNSFIPQLSCTACFFVVWLTNIDNGGAAILHNSVMSTGHPPYDRALSEIDRRQYGPTGFLSGVSSAFSWLDQQRGVPQDWIFREKCAQNTSRRLLGKHGPGSLEGLSGCGGAL